MLWGCDGRRTLTAHSARDEFPYLFVILCFFVFCLFPCPELLREAAGEHMGDGGTLTHAEGVEWS